MPSMPTGAASGSHPATIVQSVMGGRDFTCGGSRLHYGLADAGLPVGACILVALIILEGAGSVIGRGLSHLAPTWLSRLSRMECRHGRTGSAAFPIMIFPA